jgi:hypothetical protein
MAILVDPRRPSLYGNCFCYNGIGWYNYWLEHPIIIINLKYVTPKKYLKNLRIWIFIIEYFFGSFR